MICQNCGSKKIELFYSWACEANCEKDSICEIDEFGTKRWYNQKRQYHRLDGPAIEMPNGVKAWYRNDLLHRDDGPALEYTSGEKYWYQNGYLHRDDGPAVILSDGTDQWWSNGKKTK